ncbi:MAG: Helix-destabilising protein [Proteobacteria bacterium]|nr:Helix-destabilising protein [Pseudomonadota bacterium]
MSITIEIKNTSITPRNITAKQGPRAGQTFQLLEQEAYAHTFDANGVKHPYPTRIILTLEQGQQPYSAGFYTLAPNSFYTDRFQKLVLGKPQLLPMQQPHAKSVQAAA